MNNKILSAVLIAGVAATGFAGISSADSDSSTGKLLNKVGFQHRDISDEQKAAIAELKPIFEKKKAGEELSDAEQARLDELKSQLPERKKSKRAGHKGSKMGKNMTDEEKTAFEAMSDEEKEAFKLEKKTQKQAQKESHKAVINTIISGGTLTAEQETLRAEMLEKMSEDNGRKSHRAGSGIITKILSGETLSDEEKVELADMQAKRLEREAQMEVLKPILEKKKAGEELTIAEQALLDEHKENFNGKGKGQGKIGNKGGKSERKMDR